jgi:hypothetical protein
VFLVRLEEPFLMGREGSAILLIRASIEGVRVDGAVEAHAGFEEGVGSLNTVADERGQFVSSFVVGDREEMAWGMRKVFKTALEIALPSRAWMGVGLWGPVFFIVVEALQPVGRGGAGREVGNGGVRRGWDISAFERQVSIRRERGDRQQRCDEAFDLLCAWRNH